jgi:hypothetical protein
MWKYLVDTDTDHINLLTVTNRKSTKEIASVSSSSFTAGFRRAPNVLNKIPPPRTTCLQAIRWQYKISNRNGHADRAMRTNEIYRRKNEAQSNDGAGPCVLDQRISIPLQKRLEIDLESRRVDIDTAGNA